MGVVFGRRGYDEPDVELLGDDAIAGVGAVSAERSRSWWPIWLGAAALAGIGFVGLLSSGGDGEPGADEAAPVSVDEEAAGAATTEPSDALEPSERDPEIIRETRPSTDAGGSADGSETQRSDEIDNARVVSELGLTGHLYAWSGNRVDRLDLVTGEWVELEGPPHLGSDIWNRQMAATPAGFVAAIGGSAVSMDVDGNVIERLHGEAQFETNLAAADGKVWLLSAETGGRDAPVLGLHTVTPDGQIELHTTVDNPIGGMGPSMLVSSRGRVLVAQFSGGVFDLAAPGAPRVGDGIVFQGNEREILSYQCAAQLNTCGVYRLDAETWAQLQRIDTESTPSMLFGGQRAWSPDLRYWSPPWGGDVVDTIAGETAGVHVPTGSEIAPSWSADSRYLLMPGRDQLLVHDVAMDESFALQAPDGVPVSRWNAVLLHRP